MATASPTASRNQSWFSTLCFRLFRKKHTNLSTLYWTGQLGTEAIARLLTGKPATDLAVAHIPPAAFVATKIDDTVASLTIALNERRGIERLHLLVISSANLESYLQDSIRLHVANQGHHTEKPRKLTPVGDAIARPVVNRSTIPAMLTFIEELLGIKFGIHLARWKDAYRLRCAAAHNGGVVTSEVRNLCPGQTIGDNITLDWKRLWDYLASADDIASLIDRTISTDSLRTLELLWFFQEMQQTKTLPARKPAWSLAHKLGFTISRNGKRTINRKIFGE